MIKTKNPNKDRPSLKELVGKNNIVGAEIGVQQGFNAKYILDTFDVIKLYLIDPYEIYEDFWWKDKWKKAQSKKILDGKKYMYDHMEELEMDGKRRLYSYMDKVEWLRKRSSDAVNDIKDNSLDFVYIDGNHKYKYVKQDILLYVPKVKQGGLIAGHDINIGSVHKAVKEIYSDFKKKGKDWWVINR